MNDFNNVNPMQGQTPPPFPPQVQYCQPPQKEKKGKGCLWGWIVGIFFLFAFIFVCCILPVLLIVGIAATLEDTDFTSLDKNTQVITKGSDSEIVAVLDVKGVITSSEGSNVVNSTRFKEALRKVADNDNVVALILDMDTPGGEVTAADEIHHAILEFKKESEIPVITCMHSMGASGGYYIASASDHIIANRMTLTGSIGVIMSTFNATELMGKVGVTPVVFKSGKMKDIMSPTRPMSEQEKAYLDKMVKDTFAEFAKVVADGREKYETADDVMAAEFADGRVLSGQDALDFGLVDELGGFDEAVKKAKELSESSDPSVIRYSTKAPLWESLLSSKASPFSPKSVLPVESASIKAGQLYFILPQALIW
ncbi:MAG: signal peptide peptidase SppA [Victivallales bacterium]|nr:signal peptide peptidase SppA [Victivallales bacterium]